MDLISFNHGAMGTSSSRTDLVLSRLRSSSFTLHVLCPSSIPPTPSPSRPQHRVSRPSLPRPFLVNPDATYAAYNYNGIDAGSWYNSTVYLLLVANMSSNSTEVVVPWSAVRPGTITNATSAGQVHRVFVVGQNVNADGPGVLKGGFVFIRRHHWRHETLPGDVEGVLYLRYRGHIY